MMRKAKNIVVVTSYGLCEDVGLYTFSKELNLRKKAKEVEEKDAKPSYTHFALVGLLEASMLKTWVTTTPDSLPFMAGAKIGAVNQLHGSRNDVANP